MSRGLPICRGETGLGGRESRKRLRPRRRVKIELGVGSGTGPPAPSVRFGKL